MCVYIFLRLSAVRRDNARLTTKIQGMAAVPKGRNENSIIYVDN